MEATFKYIHVERHAGRKDVEHQLGEVNVNFHEGTNQLESVYTFTGDIVHFPRELSAWRLTEGGHFIAAEEPQKVWEYIKANPEKWTTTDSVPEGA